MPALDLFFFKNRKLSKNLTPGSNYFLRADRKNPSPPQEAKSKSTMGPRCNKENSSRHTEEILHHKDRQGLEQKLRGTVKSPYLEAGTAAGDHQTTSRAP